MNIQIINPIEYPYWDELIITNEQATFFHTSAWAKVLHESYNYKPLYFTLIENDRLKNLLPVMEIKSLLTGSRGVSLPFTDHCPPIAENENAFNEMFKEVINYGKKANWKSVDLKCCVNYLRGSTLPFETFLTNDLDVSQTEQEIFSTFRDSTKRNIKRAIKKGVKVSIQDTLESVREYYRLHCITRKSHGLPPQKGDKELARFISVSLGSLAETKYLLYFSYRLGYFANGEYIELKNGYDTLGKLLCRFYEKVQNN